MRPLHRSPLARTVLPLALLLTLASVLARRLDTVVLAGPSHPLQATPTLDPGTEEPSPTAATGGTGEPSPEPSTTATMGVEPSATVPEATATATDLPAATATPALRPLYFPWLDKASAAMKVDPIDRVAGDFGRVAVGPRQVYAVEGGPPRLTLLLQNTAEQRLERAGSMALEASADPRQVRLAADPEADYAYLLYQNALTVVEGLRPPEPRKLVAAPDCEALVHLPFGIFLGCDGLRLIDLDPRDNAREIVYLSRAGRSQALAHEDGLLAAAFREPVPANRPTTLVLYHTGYRQKPRLAGQLPDIGNTVAMVMRSRTVYQLVDEEGRRGLQLIDTANDNGNRTPRLLRQIAIDGIPRALAFDASARSLYVLEESWFDRRDRIQHGQTGVRVYSLKDPRQPRLTRILPLDQPAFDVAADGGLLYVAGGAEGLLVFRVP